MREGVNKRKGTGRREVVRKDIMGKIKGMEWGRGRGKEVERREGWQGGGKELREEGIGKDGGKAVY